MSAQARPEIPLLMSVEEFLDWSFDSGRKWELHNGHPVMMAPESIAHSDTQFAIRLACEKHLKPDGPCRVSHGGQGVKTATNDIRIPDVHIDCAKDNNILRSTANSPTVVFEISVTSLDYDIGDKRKAYFSNPDVQHYVVVVPVTRRVYHWQKDASTVREYQTSGTLDLLPKPGISIEIEDFWRYLPPELDENV